MLYGKNKISIAFLISIFSAFQSYGQAYIDSLQNALHNTTNDSSRVILLTEIATYFEYTGQDSNEYYVSQARTLARKIDFRKGIFLANRSLFFAINLKANYPRALELALQNLKFSDSLTNLKLYYQAFAHQDMALVKREMRDSAGYAMETRLSYELQTKSAFEDNDAWSFYSNKGMDALRRGKSDSGIALLLQSYDMAQQKTTRWGYVGLSTARLADGYKSIHQDSLARLYYQIGLNQCDHYNNLYIKGRIYMNLAQFFATKNQDSALYFAGQALLICQPNNFGDYAATVADTLARIFRKRHQPDSALKYMQVMINARESVFGASKMQQFQSLLAKQEQLQIQAAQEKERYQNRVRLIAVIAGLLIFLVISFILYSNNQQKQKANRLLHSQKLEIEKALSTLKDTQKQLIQSEKMASLGELTAGIAHEIQNPLNFVNNFSEVNSELFDEMEKEFKSGNSNEAFAIAGDIKQNLEKINLHGKRADGIVKGMLQHSMVNTGQKELIDLNALVSEYIRLNFHAMKAKDNSFQCEIREDLDPSIGKINLIPQDMGRVLQNIYNNAFYYLNEKKKILGEGFAPLLSVSTCKVKHEVELRIRDNGTGISQKNIEKIFQPFFTTKPTGQGTGLGMSLAYDIVINEHGGNIQIESVEGEYAQFIITLPSVDIS
jgi:signal transduction histidine kinase